jgi:hypothetical protein
MSSIFIRKFDEKDMEENDSKNYPISTYFPLEMNVSLFMCVLKHSLIKKDDYLLCPLYEAGDFQIGVTGSCQGTETSNEGLKREVGEELGVIPAGKIYKIREFVNDTKTYSTYACDIKNCNFILNKNLDKSKGKDNKNKKIGCFIFGNKTDILDFLSRGEIFPYKSEDNIIGVVAIKVSDSILALQDKGLI